MLKKLKTGVYGLSPLLDGGVGENTATVVIGASGAGKTIFATQFLRRGLEEGQEAIFLTLDEMPEQIVKEAIEMGWENVQSYIDKDLLVFIDASGAQFSKFIKEELADFVDDWKGAKARIVIDPLTPVMWSIAERSEQRDLVSALLRQTKKIGTVVCTLEEHGTLGNLSGPETIIPMYLADCVIHLKYVTNERATIRQLRIVKSRSSWHSQFYHPYDIVKGLGLIVQQVERPKKGKKKMPTKEELRMQLAALAKKKRLSDKVSDRILEKVDYIYKGGIGALELTEILPIILGEYESE